MFPLFGPEERSTSIQVFHFLLCAVCFRSCGEVYRFAFGAACLKVRSWKDDRHSVGYDMQPIKDFNEVTLHTLETIHTHLFNTKGPLPGKASVGGGSAVAQSTHVSDAVFSW